MTVRVSFSSQIDPAEQAAQRVSDGLADLIIETKLTTSLNRTLVIWKLLRQIEQQTSNVTEAVAHRASELCDRGYGHGV